MALSITDASAVEAVSCRILGCKSRVWLGDSHDLNLRTMERLLKESMHMPVDEAHDADAKGTSALCRRILLVQKSGGEQHPKEN